MTVIQRPDFILSRQQAVARQKLESTFDCREALRVKDTIGSFMANLLRYTHRKWGMEEARRDYGQSHTNEVLLFQTG